MGSSKNGGYEQLSTMNMGQNSFLNNLLKQYMPGGQGGKALEDQANANFKEQTVPDILSQYGGDNKGSSALNTALSGASSNLNRDLAAAKSGQTLQAGQIGLGAQPFAYGQKQPPLFMQILGLLGQNAGAASQLFLNGKTPKV